MYKQLIRLWWKQKLRNFTWKDIVVELYGYAIYFALFGGAYIGTDGVFPALLGGGVDLSDFIMVCITSLLYFDLLGKVFMKKEVTVMDAYLATRPVRRSTWDAFLLTRNLFDYWSWTSPLGVLLISVFAMTLPHALAACGAAFSASMVNAMALTCIRRADRWLLRVPMVALLLLYLVGSFAYGMVAVELLSPMMQLAVYAAINTVLVAVIYFVLTRMHCYDEHVVRTKRVHAVNASATFALDWASLWRPRRMRQSVLAVSAIMLFNAYGMWGAQEGDAGVMANFILLCAVSMPSMVLAQWTFGVEANFFHGLWTKPVSVLQLLLNKFRFFALLTTVAALLLVPMVVLGWVGWLKLAAIYVFTVGVTNLVCMPSCLFSRRLDLFSSAFFNYQGASLKINFYAFVCILPEALALLLFWLLAEETACYVLLLLGIIGLACHRAALRPLADAFVRRRHARFEEYMR